MKAVIHKADTREHAEHGWLESYHTFSFANYHAPDRRCGHLPGWIKIWWARSLPVEGMSVC